MTTVVLRKGITQARLDAALATKKTLTDYANVVVVDAGGNGDYTTLALALAAITDDDASHVYNVFVFGAAIDYSLVAARPYINLIGAERLPYKVYSAMLTQSSTGAPTATILQNTIGAIVWTRTATGKYSATLSGAFTTNKTFVIINAGARNGSTVFANAFTSSTSVVKVETFTSYDVFMETPSGTVVDFEAPPADGILLNTAIEIRVYP